jgi:hypothetical protein
MRNSRRILLFVGLPVAMCLGVLLLYDLLFIAPERSVKQVLHMYANAKLIWNDEGLYGADVTQKNFYYWTEDQIKIVQKYYEGLFMPFVPGNAAKQWLITALNLDHAPFPPITNTSVPGYFLGHGSFCGYTKPYLCVSLTLADGEQDSLNGLPIMSAGQFQYASLPSPLAGLPRKGTLIIYRYYIRVF